MALIYGPIKKTDVASKPAPLVFYIDLPKIDFVLVCDELNFEAGVEVDIRVQHVLLVLLDQVIEV